MNLLIRDIPQNGQDFEWQKDKIFVKGHIYPISGGFDLHGEIKAHVTMDCSFCANPLEIPVNENFHEIIMLQQKNRQGSSGVDVHKDDIEIFYVDGNEIELTPIIEQIIGISLPLQPKCIEKGAPKDYPKCVADWDYQKYSNQNNDENLKTNPFEVLKKLKKN